MAIELNQARPGNPGSPSTMNEERVWSSQQGLLFAPVLLHSLKNAKIKSPIGNIYSTGKDYQATFSPIISTNEPDVVDFSAASICKEVNMIEG